MESSKFRLDVRKMKCTGCDIITLIEKTIDTVNHFHLKCPVCNEDMEPMENISVVQD